ncbi:hypothetical protein Tco_0635475 [Tanacetum coccineum]
MSDMTALLDDLSYIPPNNEHNEPTQGDIGETSNEPTQATRNEFEELYSSANEALYPGCDHVTRLDFMAKFTYFKVKGKLTDSIFNEMLEWLQYALPKSKGYKFPPSYYAIKKTFKTIGLGYESIHACEHDCCLFRGEVNKDLQFCPVCNTSRWKDSDTPGKKVPRKVLRYFPIIPRLQRLGVIVVENEPDIIHLDNSSDLPPSTSGNDLDNVTFYIVLHIDGESTEVDAPPDIIDVPGEDDDISDDEDPLPHDLADSDVEDLINDDDGVEKMADVARAHGGDGGGEDPSRPPPTSFGCAGCFINRGKGKRKPNLGGVKAGRKTRERTRNQVLKDAVAANKGRPIEIGFEDRADNTVVPTGPYSTQWGNYFGEMIRSIPLYHPSWQKVPAGDKARLMATLGTLFDLRPHMDSSRWTEISEGINMHLQKAYNTNKASFKGQSIERQNPYTGVSSEAIRRARPEEITAAEWDKYIAFWNDPKNLARATQNRLNRQKSVSPSRDWDPGRCCLRVEMRKASGHSEYPSLIDTFGEHHLLMGSDSKYSDMFKEFESGGASGSGGCGDDEEGGDDEDGDSDD